MRTKEKMHSVKKRNFHQPSSIMRFDHKNHSQKGSHSQNSSVNLKNSSEDKWLKSLLGYKMKKNLPTQFNQGNPERKVHYKYMHIPKISNEAHFDDIDTNFDTDTLKTSFTTTKSAEQRPSSDQLMPDKFYVGSFINMKTIDQERMLVLQFSHEKTKKRTDSKKIPKIITTNFGTYSTLKHHASSKTWSGVDPTTKASELESAHNLSNANVANKERQRKTHKLRRHIKRSHSASNVFQHKTSQFPSSKVGDIQNMLKHHDSSWSWIDVDPTSMASELESAHSLSNENFSRKERQRKADQLRTNIKRSHSMGARVGSNVQHKTSKFASSKVWKRQNRFKKKLSLNDMEKLPSAKKESHREEDAAKYENERKITDNREKMWEDDNMSADKLAIMDSYKEKRMLLSAVPSQSNHSIRFNPNLKSNMALKVSAKQLKNKRLRKNDLASLGGSWHSSLDNVSKLGSGSSMSKKLRHLNGKSENRKSVDSFEQWVYKYRDYKSREESHNPNATSMGTKSTALTSSEHLYMDLDDFKIPLGNEYQLVIHQPLRQLNDIKKITHKPKMRFRTFLKIFNSMKQSDNQGKPNVIPLSNREESLDNVLPNSEDPESDEVQVISRPEVASRRHSRDLRSGSLSEPSDYMMTRRAVLAAKIAEIMPLVEIREEPTKKKPVRNFVYEAQTQSWKTKRPRQETNEWKQLKSRKFPTRLVKIRLPSDGSCSPKAFVIRRYCRRPQIQPTIYHKQSTCRTCNFFGLGKIEADNALIREMKAKWQRIQLMNYYRFLKRTEALEYKILAQSANQCRKNLDSCSMISPL